MPRSFFKDDLDRDKNTHGGSLAFSGLIRPHYTKYIREGVVAPCGVWGPHIGTKDRGASGGANLGSVRVGIGQFQTWGEGGVACLCWVVCYSGASASWTFRIRERSRMCGF